MYNNCQDYYNFRAKRVIISQIPFDGYIKDQLYYDSKYMYIKTYSNLEIIDLQKDLPNNDVTISETLFTANSGDDKIKADSML